MIRLSLPEKLALNKFIVDEGHAHIIINNDICITCTEKICLSVCPAGLFSENNRQISVEWAGCLECGTCKASCSNDALSWTYPNGGYGIVYRQG
jgi:Ferredoxin-like protein